MSLIESIACFIAVIAVLLIILVPWFSIVDIHKSIDRLTDAIKEQNEILKGRKE